MSKLRSQLNNLTVDPVAAQTNITEQVSANMRAIEEGNNSENRNEGRIKVQRGEYAAGGAALDPASTSTDNNPQMPIDQQAPSRSAALSTGENLRQQMTGEINKMRGELATLQQNASETNDRAILDDIQQISASIHQLQAHQTTSSNQVGDQVGEMAGELRGIHHEIRKIAQNSQPEMGGQEISQQISNAIQVSYEEIAKKLDNLGSSDVAGYIATLSEKLEVFKENLPASDPQTLLRIEGQLQGLGEGITSLVENSLTLKTAVADTEAARSHDAILPEYFENLEHRLDEITRAVIASAPIDSGDSDGEAFERIEARIASLAKSVDNLSLDNLQGTENSQLSELIQVPEQLRETLAGMEQRMSEISMSAISEEIQNREGFSGQIDGLIHKIDQLQSISANLSSSVPVDAEVGEKLDQLSLLLERAINSGDSSIGQLDRQISELSARIDNAVTTDESEKQARQQNETRIVEELQSIVARVDKIDPALQTGTSFNSQLSALEEQMAGIASQLNSIGPQSDLSAIESRLGGIEEQFAATRDVTIEAANHALQQTATIGSAQDQAALISSLAEELKNLSNASLELKGHSFKTFDAVRDSLAMILDRINGIELRMAGNDQSGGSDEHLAQQKFPSTDMTIAARNYAADIASQSASQSTSQSKGHDTRLPTVKAPSLDLENIPEIDPQLEEVDPPIDDLPLEPGSGAPDMNALVRQAKKNKRGQVLEDSQQNPTDFIAAARRAAQAAANEAELAQGADAGRRTSGSKTSINRKLSRKKKLMFFAVTILLLAALAAPIKNLLPLGGSNPEIVTSQDQDIKPDALTNVAENQAAKNQNSLVQSSQDTASQIAPGEADEPTVLSKVLPKMPELNSPGTEKLASNAQPKTTPTTKLIPAPEAGSAKLNTERQVATLPVETPSKILADIEAEKAVMPPADVGPVALRLAAFNGDPTAMFEVGRRYTNGINGTPDFVSAIKWYSLAAKANHAPAQYRLGNFNEKGHGGAPNVNEAAKWYLLAANQGNALAMHNLAVINAMGVLEGGANLKQATLWFANAANLGVKDSQVNLGIVYAKAMGVEADYVKAYKWFAIAARAGDKDAAQKRDTIAKQMHDDQLKQARGEVELWKPQELDQTANSVDIPAAWNSDKNITASLTSSAKIMKAQNILIKLGYNPGAADGLMGDNTTKAIQKFQKNAGILVNGKVTPELINALEKASP